MSEASWDFKRIKWRSIAIGEDIVLFQCDLEDHIVNDFSQRQRHIHKRQGEVDYGNGSSINVGLIQQGRVWQVSRRYHMLKISLM
ncbi:hypothetical protein A2U01_0024146 [Trifolium medium]|uniref:Uncharacterized protein n=1 Tax=Trifolium medium TaxID=97028 RepID=A0A392NTF0_9FABA|nr:hypothetical protein [Trifolium medium]